MQTQTSTSASLFPVLPERAPAKEFGLTTREYQVCQLAALGLPTKEVGHRLKLAPGTIKIYLSHIYDKLAIYGVENQGTLIRFWMTHVENRGDCHTCLLRLVHMGGPLEKQQ